MRAFLLTLVLVGCTQKTASSPEAGTPPASPLERSTKRLLWEKPSSGPLLGVANGRALGVGYVNDQRDHFFSLDLDSGVEHRLADIPAEFVPERVLSGRVVGPMVQPRGEYRVVDPGTATTLLGFQAGGEGRLIAALEAENTITFVTSNYDSHSVIEVRAFDTRSWLRLWMKTLKPDDHVAATTDGKRVILSLPDRHVALDPRTGKEQWSSLKQVSCLGGCDTIAAGAALVAVVPRWEDRVTLLNASTGAAVQSVGVPTLGDVKYLPTPTLFLAANAGALRAFDPVTGAERWHVETAGDVRELLADRGFFYVSTSGGLTTAYDQGGKVVWRFGARVLPVPEGLGPQLLTFTDDHIWAFRNEPGEPLVPILVEGQVTLETAATHWNGDPITTANARISIGPVKIVADANGRYSTSLIMEGGDLSIRAGVCRPYEEGDARIRLESKKRRYEREILVHPSCEVD